VNILSWPTPEYYHYSMCIVVSAADKQRLASAKDKASTLHSCDDHSCLTVTNRMIVICRKHRQKRNVTLIVLEAILQWLNLVFYVVPNALNVADPCFIIADDWSYLGFARWTCWNTVSHLSSRSMQCHSVALTVVAFCLQLCLPLGSCCLARAFQMQNCAAMRPNNEAASLGFCWCLKAA